MNARRRFFVGIFAGIIPCVITLLMLSTAPAAHAHEISMAEMTLSETAPGEFVWGFGVPGRNRPVAEELTPQWPEGCHADAQTVRCAGKGLVGTLSIQGVGEAYSAVVVRIRWRGGEQSTHTLTAAQPKVQLLGAASDPRGRGEVAYAYGALGVAHILSGWDHLLFVIALLYLVGFQPRLVWTLTAFTLAHSLTLGASALGWLTLRTPPVEAIIALSIVAVCAEALRSGDSLTRRWPALVAFLFGLVHGLGFAGALRDVGLPETHLLLALLTFNVGVEIGQLLIVGLAFGLTFAITQLVGPHAAATRFKRPALYAMGATASYWLFARLLVMVA